MSHIDTAFAPEGRVLPIRALLPVKKLSASIRTSSKFEQIASSIAEVGLVEPPVVYADPHRPGTYLLLDGHLRVEVLKDRGEAEVFCLLATDDEAFTYNKRVNRLAPIQEHFMIMRALERGVSEQRIARALNVDVARIKQKRRLLDGICPEVVELLKDKHLASGAIAQLKKMGPTRQIEAAELMLAANNYSEAYARALLAATPQDQLVNATKAKRINGVSLDQMARMEREMANLQRDLKLVEESYGDDVLNLVVARGYLAKLFSNTTVARYLDRHQPDISRELRELIETISQEHKGVV